MSVPPESVLGVGLAILGIGFPAAITIMRLLPAKKSPSIIEKPIFGSKNGMTDAKCEKNQENLMKLTDARLETIHVKIGAQTEKIDTIQQDMRDVKGITVRILEGIKISHRGGDDG